VVIETMRFRLAHGVTEADFLAADKALQQEFAYQQPGLLRRTTARGEGGWIVVDLWASADDARACEQRWDDDPHAQRFMSLIDPASVEVGRYEEMAG
jgi:hypothetical protein